MLHVKLAKLEGEVVWHHHDDADDRRAEERLRHAAERAGLGRVSFELEPVAVVVVVGGGALLVACTLSPFYDQWHQHLGFADQWLRRGSFATAVLREVAVITDAQG